jgi:hypothetical protein
MSDQLTTLEGCMEALQAKIDECPKSDVPQPVGHNPPFDGSLTTIGHCAQVVYAEIAAKNFKSETLHTHLAQGYGEAAVMALSDGPKPVGSGGSFGWLQLLLQLIVLVGEKQ